MILKKIEELKSFLKKPQNIVIIGHKDPDGDAVGSTLALKRYFELKGHNCTVIVPNNFPGFLSWIPGSKTIYKFDSQKTKSQKAINNSNIIFLLDFNSLHRAGTELQSTLSEYSKDFAIIDHHQQADEFEYMFYDDKACSTCQLVYEFIEANDDLGLINKDIATCIYSGIATDTLSFRVRTTTSKTHRIISNLIEKGAENHRIHSNIYDSNSYGRLKLLGQALRNLKSLPEYKTAYTTLTHKEKIRYNFKKGDTEGFVNYALSLKGIVFAAIFIEDIKYNIIKISFRSKGSFSVNKFARTHFEGGGHNNSAGGKSALSLEKTVEKFTGLLAQYKQELEFSYV